MDSPSERMRSGVGPSIAGLLFGGMILYVGMTQTFGVATGYARESLSFTPGEPGISCPNIVRGQPVDLWPAPALTGTERVRLVTQNCIAARTQFAATERPFLRGNKARVLRWAYKSSEQDGRTIWQAERYTALNARWEPDHKRSNTIRVVQTPQEIEIALGTVSDAENEDWLEVRLTTGEVGYIKKKLVEIAEIDVN